MDSSTGRFRIHLETTLISITVVIIIILAGVGRKRQQSRVLCAHQRIDVKFGTFHSRLLAAAAARFLSIGARMCCSGEIVVSSDFADDFDDDGSVPTCSPSPPLVDSVSVDTAGAAAYGSRGGGR
ncbi:unnamed protein product [Sphagnum balticum]